MTLLVGDLEVEKFMGKILLTIKLLACQISKILVSEMFKQLDCFT